MPHPTPVPAPARPARALDYSRPFLPAGLSLAEEAGFLSPGERRTLSQVQARTHAAVAGMLERVTGAGLLAAPARRRLADRDAAEALLRVASGKLRRRESLRDLEASMARDMPPGHAIRPMAFAQRALRAGPWASVALALLHEHSRLAHRQAFAVAREACCPAWREGALLPDAGVAHETVVAREFARVQAALEPDDREAALGEFLALVADLRSALAAQAGADARYFLALAAPRRAAGYEAPLAALIARAYRWQFLAAGAMERGFRQPLHALLDAGQAARVREAFSATESLDATTPLAVAA